MSDGQRIDLGHGHILEIVEDWVGAVLHHPHARVPGYDCGFYSYIGFDPEKNTPACTWKILSRDPLTLVPSIECKSCGDHGWIRDGKWVPA